MLQWFEFRIQFRVNNRLHKESNATSNVVVFCGSQCLSSRRVDSSYGDCLAKVNQPSSTWLERQHRRGSLNDKTRSIALDSERQISRD